MARPRKPQYYIAKQGFSTRVDGKKCRVMQGAIAEHGAAILETPAAHYFAPIDDVVTFPAPARKADTVEAATAAPGELRDG